MKKILYSIFLTILLFPVSVLAEGYISASPSSLTIEKGSSASFTITAYNAIGDVSISSNNSGIASVNTGEWGTGMVDELQTKTGTITVTGVGVGTATITLVIDAATFDGDDLAGQTKTIAINVIEKPAPAPTPTPTPTPTPSQPSTPNNNNNNNSNTNQNNNLSKNTNLKAISVSGYELVKESESSYSLVVNNSVDKIVVEGEVEDSKSKIDGLGEKTLSIGENNFVVTVTAEAGNKKEYTIKVTRKDGFYLKDLEDSLKENNTDIIIVEEEKISNEQLKLIKESKKTVTFNYYDADKKLLYSWSIDGNKINDIKEINPKINFGSNNLEKISKLTNYSDSLYFNLENKESLPKNTKIKIYVGNKYKDGELINTYYYNEKDNKIELVNKDIKVVNDYVELEVANASEYIITKSAIESEKTNIFMITTVIETILLVGMLGYIVYIKIKFQKTRKIKK